MMLQCPSCHRDLEFSGDRPSFCAFCGHALEQKNRENTIAYDRAKKVVQPGDALPEAAEAAESVWLVSLICVVLLPLIWVFCAFLLRSGITLRLGGWASPSGCLAARCTTVWQAPT
jgi:hypothetical protein